MRTRLLVAVALLISADLARAQQSPASVANPTAPGGGLQLAAAPGVPVVPPPGPPLAPDAGPVLGGPFDDGHHGVVTHGGGRGGNHGLWWGTAGGLVAWIQEMKLPTPLVTSGPADSGAPGALRQQGTFTLFGDRIDFDRFLGFYAAAGLFCDDSNATSIDAGGFVLLEESTSFNATSDANGFPVIARPIYNVLAEQEGAFIDSRPGFARGSVTINADSQLWSAEANLRCHLGNERLRGEAFVGGRYMRLEENLTIADTLIPLRLDTFTFQGGFNFVNPPDFLQDLDQFRTKNMFYGGQLGGVLIWEDWWYFVRLSGKVGFGLTEQRAQIAGTSTLVSPQGNITAEGGILATRTNIGSYSRTVFGIVPEWGITGGFYVTDWMRVSAGYSVLLWNRVVRPGDAIDRGVNPAFVPTATDFGGVATPARPAFNFNDASFWVQAVSAGVEFVY
jgi:hypothetical protein